MALRGGGAACLGVGGEVNKPKKHVMEHGDHPTSGLDTRKRKAAELDDGGETEPEGDAAGEHYGLGAAAEATRGYDGVLVQPDHQVRIALQVALTLTDTSARSLTTATRTAHSP